MSFIFLRNRVTGGAAFSPASLFSSGEEGAWYEPSPTTCFTDTAGTTAASVGDRVARINDLSGNGNHATQTNPDARPFLRQTAGGLYYLDFDGADDVLSSSYASPLTQPQTAIVGATPHVTSGIILGSADSSGTARQLLYDNIFVFAGSQFDAGSLTNGAPYVLTPVWNTTSSSLRINGSLAAAGNVGTNTRDGEAIGAYGNGAALFKELDYFGHVSINRLLTAQEISDTESYLAAKSGVTL